MAQVCQVTGKKPLVGNSVSHSNIKTKRRTNPNLQYHRFWVPFLKRRVKLRLSAKGVKIINKRGVEPVVREILARGEKI